MGIKILLADDSVTAQNMGKKILSEAGYEVVTVSNGAAAAKKIAEIKPELVLLDVFMPGYSGLELCEKIRNSAETSKLPVLLTVGKMEPYSPQEGARVRADGVIIKPFEASDLTAAVERLAQKMKPAAKAPQPDSAKKISSSANFSEEDDLVPKKETASEPDYQPTIRLDAAQIAAMLKQSPAQGATAEEFSVAAPAHSMEEFSVTPATPIAVSESSLNANVPAFGIDIDQNSEIPSYMSQYLSETRAEIAVAGRSTSHESEASAARSFESPLPVEPASAEDMGATVALSSNSFLNHLEQATADANVLAPEGLEYTAAAPVPEVPIAKEAGLELTMQSVEAPTMVLKDPELVTDPHSATMDFVTQFGTRESGPADDLLQAMSSSGAEKSSADEFEARLNAAMTAFGEPSAELPELLHTGTDSPQAISELPPGFPSPEIHVEASPAEFQLPAMETATQPEPFLIPAPADLGVEEVAPEAPAPIEISPSFSEPQLEKAPSFSTPAATSAMREEPTFVEAVSDTVIAPVASETTDASMEAVSAPETDEAVIQQMREAFSGLPADHSHLAEEAEAEPAPIAMAAVASASAGGAALAPQISHEAELEIGRALSAAVAAEASTEVASADARVKELASRSDANNMAEAVENVMRRELPNLIWKIMAELDLRKRS